MKYEIKIKKRNGKIETRITEKFGVINTHVWSRIQEASIKFKNEEAISYRRIEEKRAYNSDAIITCNCCDGEGRLEDMERHGMFFYHRGCYDR